MENSELTIKKGYKQTEVGIIPEDWSAEKIKNVSPLQRGFDLPNRELRKGDFPVVYSNGILNFHNEYKAKAPGVVTGRSGTIGKVNYIEKNYFPHNTSLWVTDFKGNDPKFIYYLYNAVKLERFGTGSGVPTLNRNDVHLHKVALPPLTEQEAIAEVLSDADALITSLDQLITKKRNIKQGTMQLLLTGKKRLPNFSGDWETKTLIQVINQFIVPMRDKPKYFNGNIPWCRIEDFAGKYLSDSKSNQYVNAELIDSMNLKIYSVDTVLVSCSANLGKCAIVKRPLITNQTFIGLVVNESKLFNEFLYYYMTHNAEELNLLSSGTTISYLSREQFEIFEMYIPPTIEEQKAIAQILSEMDAEIEALETQRDKYKAVKQGMMQELLTGKKRLK